MSERLAVSRLRTVGEHIELDVGDDIANSPRYNDDIAPTRASQRTWTRWNVASLWVGMAICVPTYTLGGVLTAYFGLSVAEALWTILIANVVVLIPLTLNAYPGTRYGIPCPVVMRASFGIIGSNVPSLIRALVACGWFGVQTLFGGIAIHLMLSAMFDGWAALGGVGEVLGFFIFWVANLAVVIRGAESIKHPRGAGGAAAADRRNRPDVLGAAENLVERSAGHAGDAARGRAVLRLLHGRPDGDGRLLGHAVAEHPRLQPLSRERSAARCSDRSSACR